MENQEIKTETKKSENTGVKPAEKKSGGSLKFILVLFILGFIGGGAYWAYGKLQPYINEFTGKAEPAKNLTVKAPGQPSNQTLVTSTEPDELDVVVSLLPPLVADADETANTALSSELGQTPEAQPQPQQNNKIFVLYMAARDLRDSLETPERFNKELSFVRVVSLDYPELQSKIELLELAANSGIPTHDSLLAELEVLQERMRSKNHGSFVANVQNSLSKLIVVSKIEGEVRNDDYNSIIKRAEIAIEKDDLPKASKELAKLGADSASVTEKINNLSNMRELTEYLVDFAKGKIASQQ